MIVLPKFCVKKKKMIDVIGELKYYLYEIEAGGKFERITSTSGTELHESLSQAHSFPLPIEKGRSSNKFDFIKRLLGVLYVWKTMDPICYNDLFKSLPGDWEFQAYACILFGCFEFCQNLSKEQKRTYEIQDLEVDFIKTFLLLPDGFHVQHNFLSGVLPTKTSSK